MENEEPTNEDEQEAPETSLREDLENAIEEYENDEESGETEDAPESKESGEAGDPTERPEDGKVGDPEGDPEPPGINAPIGLSAEAREAWKDVPDVVKEHIQGREKEMAEAMANTGEARRTHTALTNLAQSYAPILAAEGAETPMAAVEGLFKTVAELRMGTPQQAATKMANLIKHYGVDISMLDSALAGQPVASPEMTAMQQLIDQRLAPVNDFLTQHQQQQQGQHQQAQQAVNNELQEFAKGAEFLNDVRHDMADLIDLASKRGQVMSFEDAYKRACAVHPTISGILEKRAADAALLAGKERDKNKRNASSSLRSGVGDSAPAASDGTLRGDIEAAWNDAQE